MKITIFLAVFLLAAIACSNDNKPRAIKRADNGMPKCKTDLQTFADTLTLDTSLLLNDYFNKRVFTLEGCDLKVFRGGFEVQASIALILLKINEYYLKTGYKDAMAEPIFSISATSRKLMEEYTFMIYQRDDRYPENLRTSDVKDLIERDQRLFNIKQIKEIYSNSIRLEPGAKKRFRY